jgi:predicted glycogen debranching enzyme
MEATAADRPALTRRLSADELRQAGRSMPEWLLTNGMGGYSSGTVRGALARRYHGLLVAALAAPLGRVVMLTAIDERLRLPSGAVEWLSNNLIEEIAARHDWLQEFSLELGLPHWTYRLPEGVLHKRIFMVHGQNSVLLRYEYHGAGSLRLGLRPFLAPRPHEASVEVDLAQPYETAVTAAGLELRFDSPLPAMQFRFDAPRAAFTFDRTDTAPVLYAIERDRGYDSEGALWSPGYVRCDLADGESASLLASVAGWDTISALSADDIQRAERERRQHLLTAAGTGEEDPVAAELVLAADQFIVTPSWRTRDIARARAAGLEPRSIVAGYHWFTDWGRDTMISLEGLTLATGREQEGRAILLSFAQHMKDGLIPNLFPEGDQAGLYHTADATLWMFHAVNRYATATGDWEVVERLLPAMAQSIDHHLAGTRFRIQVDPADGLLSQGEPGYQLTWMDAKVDDWVVTPRRGKAVEINALWFNALRLIAEWTDRIDGSHAARRFTALADRVAESFNERFWYPEGRYLFDVIDGEAGHDAALRPNQVLAIALDHPVLRQDRWAPVLNAVEAHLLTPVGLRSLAPDHPDYKPQYYGDLRARDAAYHQGTVWAWLIGPYVDAWLKVSPEREADAGALLEGLVDHLGHAGLGTLSEIFDAAPPYTARGCIAQAWSVAEVLRLWRRLRRGVRGHGASDRPR